MQIFLLLAGCHQMVKPSGNSLLFENIYDNNDNNDNNDNDGDDDDDEIIKTFHNSQGMPRRINNV